MVVARSVVMGLELVTRVEVGLCGDAIAWEPPTTLL